MNLGIPHRILTLISICFIGCIREEIPSAQTRQTSLYLFDSTSNQILAYNDLDSLYNASIIPIATKILSNSNLSQVTNLAWGGMTLDTQADQLYLISESGTITRINRIREQTGLINSTDLTIFTLDSGQRLFNSKFSQASIDPVTHTLYVAENGENLCRIWVIPNAGTRLQNETITLNALQVSNDSGGRSIVANNGTIYAYADGGSSVLIGTDLVIGPRLRKGSSSGFQNVNQLIGSSTQLGTYGSLALDTANNIIFVGLHLQDGNRSINQSPVLAFDSGIFGLGYNQPPKFTLGDSSLQRQLRVLAHGGNKAWLIALVGSGSIGNNTITIWMAPQSGSVHKTLVIPGTPSRIFKGLALDGNAN